MQIPGTQPPVESLSPLQVLAELAKLAGRHFNQLPELLTTDRSGRFEDGWRRAPESPAWVAADRKFVGLKQRRYIDLRLEMLIRQYVEHPGADYSLLARNIEFPQSVELLLPVDLTPPPAD